MKDNPTKTTKKTMKKTTKKTTTKKTADKAVKPTPTQVAVSKQREAVAPPLKKSELVKITAVRIQKRNAEEIDRVVKKNDCINAQIEDFLIHAFKQYVTETPVDQLETRLSTRSSGWPDRYHEVGLRFYHQDYPELAKLEAQKERVPRAIGEKEAMKQARELLDTSSARVAAALEDPAVVKAIDSALEKADKNLIINA